MGLEDAEASNRPRVDGDVTLVDEDEIGVSNGDVVGGLLEEGDKVRLLVLGEIEDPGEEVPLRLFVFVRKEEEPIEG